MTSYQQLQQELEVFRLAQSCSTALRATTTRQSPATTREYYDALTLADMALELALEAGLDGSLVRQCELLQELCQTMLQSAYAKFDAHDRVVYEKKAASHRIGDEETDEETESGVDEEDDEAESAEWREVVW